MVMIRPASVPISIIPEKNKYMPSIDWSTFTVRININASPDALYKAWTSSKAIEYWFLRKSDYYNAKGELRHPDEEVEAGDQYTWYWHGYDDKTFEKGSILELNGKDLFRFNFGKAGNCTVRIKEEEGQTIVELTQEDIPTDEQSRMNYHVGCKSGWTFHLADMKSLFEGGPDLRNKDERLKNMMNS